MFKKKYTGRNDLRTSTNMSFIKRGNGNGIGFVNDDTNEIKKKHWATMKTCTRRLFFFFCVWTKTVPTRYTYTTEQGTAQLQQYQHLSIRIWVSVFKLKTFSIGTAMLSLCEYSKFFGGSGEMMWNIAIFAVVFFNFERFAANFSSFEKRHILFAFRWHRNRRYLSSKRITIIFTAFIRCKHIIPPGKQQTFCILPKINENNQ